MNIRNVTFDQLTDTDLAAWSAIQRAHPAFCSPFFRPEFTQLVASVRPDVEVAVLEQAGTPVGFFPFQRSRSHAAKPVCGWLSEFHGLVAAPDIDCDPRALLRACRLASWEFHHLVAAHPSFEQFTWSSADSPYIDLADGFDSYMSRRENGRSLMGEHRQKGRKFEKEFGSTRCEFHVSDPAVLAACMEWKDAQARRTGRLDILKDPNSWIVQLLYKTLACQGEDFGSVMSVYYVGDLVASVNFGMRSGDVFHTWMTAYNRVLGNRSPGILHWIETLKAAESRGIRRIILGKGDEEHKRRLMSGVDRVGYGYVDSRPTATAVRRAWWRTRQSIKASPLRAPLQVPARIMNRFSTWLEYR
jgi:CelD/BcsL family acetyltransferase involved in cellulose biosynthesis